MSSDTSSERSEGRVDDSSPQDVATWQVFQQSLQLAARKARPDCTTPYHRAYVLTIDFAGDDKTELRSEKQVIDRFTRALKYRFGYEATSLTLETKLNGSNFMNRFDAEVESEVIAALKSWLDKCHESARQHLDDPGSTPPAFIIYYRGNASPTSSDGKSVEAKFGKPGGPGFRWSAIRSVLQPADNTKFLCILDCDRDIVEYLSCDPNIEYLASRGGSYRWGRKLHDFTEAFIDALERLSRSWPFSAVQLMEELERGRNSAHLKGDVGYKTDRRPHAFASFVFSKVPGVMLKRKTKPSKHWNEPMFHSSVRGRVEIGIHVRDMTTVPEKHCWDGHTAQELIGTKMERITIKGIDDEGAVHVVIPYLEWQAIEEQDAYIWIAKLDSVGYSLDATLDLPMLTPEPTHPARDWRHDRYGNRNPIKPRRPEAIAWNDFIDIIRETAATIKFPELSPVHQPGLAPKRKRQEPHFGHERVQMSVQVDSSQDIPEEHRYAPRIPVTSEADDDRLVDIIIKDVDYTKKCTIALVVLPHKIYSCLPYHPAYWFVAELAPADEVREEWDGRKRVMRVHRV